MVWLALAALILIICFSGVLLFGPPYLPTLSPQVEQALDLARLTRGQTLLELGCGDGKVLIAAAKRELQVVGYELNPLLVVVSWLRTRRYGRQVRVRWGNFLTQQWPPAEAIFIFGLQRIMPAVDKKVMQYPHKPVKLVSFAFHIAGKEPDIHQNGLYIYDYPEA